MAFFWLATKRNSHAKLWSAAGNLLTPWWWDGWYPLKKSQQRSIQAAASQQIHWAYRAQGRRSTASASPLCPLMAFRSSSRQRLSVLCSWMSTLCNALLTSNYDENIIIHQLKTFKTLRYYEIAESLLSDMATQKDKIW